MIADSILIAYEQEGSPVVPPLGLQSLTVLACESFGRCRSIGIRSQVMHAPQRQKQLVTELGKPR